MKAKFVKAFNAIELIHDNDKGCGCKGKHHLLRYFSKLYILLYKKTLDCKYFENLFLNNSSNIELDILEKQHYYINFCHKLYEDFLDYPNPLKCPLCDDNKKYRLWNTHKLGV